MKPRLLVLLFAGATLIAASWAKAEAPSWPASSQTSKPWTRWWWLGSAVDASSLRDQLQAFAQAGLGGVEICPIYGVQGEETREKDFLSPEWCSMLKTTAELCREFGLGLDVTTGTGWPFGGPWVQPSAAMMSLDTSEWSADQAIPKKFVFSRENALSSIAVSTSGERVNLLPFWKNDQLQWQPPSRGWKVQTAQTRSPMMKVKRAAPGGEGWVIDPFSVEALQAYLAPFDRSKASSTQGIRSQFHDSFEYFGANWTKRIFEKFQQRHGYDLRAHLDVFFGEADPQRRARVKRDYRDCLSHLHMDFMRFWTNWAHGHGQITRNQAHGAPCNLVDLYAIADIPETETFGPLADDHLPMLKFAASAAHLKGRSLSSAESFTWLGEHFQTSLADLKSTADYLWLSGANHLFFHGIPFSPTNASWPGWQFYASVNMGPQGGLWRDMPAFTGYIDRVQRVLQAGRSDSDLLLYFPCDELFQQPEGAQMPITMHNVEQLLLPQPFYQSAIALDQRGTLYDHISDDFIAQLRVENGRLTLNSQTWQVLLMPNCRCVSLKTIKKLHQLAEDGATILWLGELPQTVPGWHEFAAEETEMRSFWQKLQWQDLATGVQTSRIGNGCFLRAAGLPALMDQAKVRREPLREMGLQFIRRDVAGAKRYFVVNRSTQVCDAFVSLAVKSTRLLMLDPTAADSATNGGLAAQRFVVTEALGNRSQFRLRLLPGASLILCEMPNDFKATAWSYGEPDQTILALPDHWSLEFMDGGPTLPAPQADVTLGSWTAGADPALQSFSGTARYRCRLQRPAAAADCWLDLGELANSASVTLNGEKIGTVWSRPFQLKIPQQSWRDGENELAIEVTNLAANRIADLDRRQVPWKKFKEINIVGKDYKPLDASHWPVMPAGLLGPVRLRANRDVAAPAD